MRTSGFLKTLLASAVAAGACRTASPSPSVPIVQPGAPGQPSRTVAASASAAAPSFTDADVKFMQGMIHHHAQALDMVQLLKTRTNSDDMKKLGQRIELSQADEIKMMRNWLESRGQDIPATGEHAQHMGGSPMMPGMLTPEQMNQLAAAKGPAFDRLFLEFMIQHHAGALTMVKGLFATPGAAQDSDIFAFVSDVDADQRMEIARMSGMLKELQK
jgi:uncharacterized protein (DUF305 family)